MTAPELLPVEIGQPLSARLLQAISTAASDDDSQAGLKILLAAIQDPAVHTVVLTLRLGSEPGASLLQVQRLPDPLVQWVGLSCI